MIHTGCCTSNVVSDKVQDATAVTSADVHQLYLGRSIDDATVKGYAMKTYFKRARKNSADECSDSDDEVTVEREKCTCEHPWMTYCVQTKDNLINMSKKHSMLLLLIFALICNIMILWFLRSD